MTASRLAISTGMKVNRLYRRMRTGKWYQTLDQLQNQLERSGWTVVERTFSL